LILKFFLNSILIPSLILFVKTNRGRINSFCVLYSAATLYGALLCYNSDMHLNSAVILHFVLLIFLLKSLWRKLVLMCLFKPQLSYCYVYAQILFWRIYQIQTLQHKQTRDLSSSNRGRLVNKVLYCRQIQEECLKTFVAGFLCVSSSLWIVNPLFMMVQG